MVTRRLWLTFGVTLGVAQPAGLDKCVMTRIHHYSIVQSISTALEIFCALPVRLSPSPRNHWYFYCAHRFIFSQCHVVGIMHYVAFSDWLLLLNNMHLRFFHGLRASSFLPSTACYSLVRVYHSLSTRRLEDIGFLGHNFLPLTSPYVPFSDALQRWA